MKTRFALLLSLLAVLIALWGCDSADNPIAPTGSVITITANPTQISLNGQASVITITGFRPDGNPLNPGTQITLSTSNGLLRQSNSINGESANLVEMQGGRATVYLFGEGRQGAATVTAGLTSGGDAAAATVDVQIGDDDSSKPNVVVDANPSAISVGGSSTITVQARNADGSALGNATVNLRTSIGTLSSTSPTTDNNGQATVQLTANTSGTATVTASVGSSDEMTVDVAVGKPVVELVANPSELDVLQQATISISLRDENDRLITSSRTVFMDSQLGTLSRSSTGNQASSLEFNVSGGRATVFFTAGTEPGTGQVTAFIEESAVATETIQINNAPAAITLTPDTSIVNRTTDSQLVLSALVTDSQNNRVTNEIVAFDAITLGGQSLGFTCSETPCTAPTGGDGIATVTLTFLMNTIPADVTTFNVEASVRNKTVLDQRPITVQ